MKQERTSKLNNLSSSKAVGDPLRTKKIQEEALQKGRSARKRQRLIYYWLLLVLFSLRYWYLLPNCARFTVLPFYCLMFSRCYVCFDFFQRIFTFPVISIMMHPTLRVAQYKLSRIITAALLSAFLWICRLSGVPPHFYCLIVNDWCFIMGKYILIKKEKKW